jgi:hypothetical protein
MVGSHRIIRLAWSIAASFKQPWLDALARVGCRAAVAQVLMIDRWIQAMDFIVDVNSVLPHTSSQGGPRAK